MTVTFLVAAFAAIIVIALIAVIVFGGPHPPPPLNSVNEAFKDFSLEGLPSLQRLAARDGVGLTYREYLPSDGNTDACVVLVHGSAGRSDRLHRLAGGFASGGYRVLVPDVRGHGESGRKGSIEYVGQLEDDLEDFFVAKCPRGKTSLVGFSAGGGFALRFAADSRHSLFRNYLLMAPFLSQTAATYRPGSGGWISVGLPRIVGLMLLNRFGIRRFNDLLVTAFALSPQAQEQLTPSYSFSLAMNFRPNNHYRADIAAVAEPMEVLVGDKDDQFYSDRFRDEFQVSKSPVPVTVMADVGHVNLTISPLAVQAAVDAVGRLNAIA